MNVKKYLNFIKIEHTVFDLPFAYAGMLLANYFNLKIIILLGIASTAARISGMVINRIVDLPLDRENPRTQKRELVTGEISPRKAWSIFFISTTIFIISSFLLNFLAFIFSPILILLFYLYPITKRHKIISHIFLGFSIGIIVIGGYIGTKGIFPTNISVWLLTISVSFWISSFDIIYQNQDRDFDKYHGIKSIPVLYPNRVKEFVFLFYLISLLFLSVFYYLIGLPYLLFIIPIAFLYFYRIKYIDKRDVDFIFRFDIPIPFIILLSLIIKFI
ncbi:MAG: 4-hydroxybenzoate octaprenyltransferase [Thermoplasmata archaeon]